MSCRGEILRRACYDTQWTADARVLAPALLVGLAACLEVKSDTLLGDKDPKSADYVGIWMLVPKDEKGPGVHFSVRLEDPETGRLSTLGAHWQPMPLYVRVLGD